jgi:predicted ATP-dependent endonuclease of OLD family
MELVYLWVEEYKNIYRQGFNFSPRFECIFDKNTKELTINENKDYMSIFPERINITAIVGENGTGKSSLLNSLITYINEDEYFFVFRCNKKLYYSNPSKIKLNFLPKDLEIEEVKSNQHNNYYEFKTILYNDNLFIDNIYIGCHEKTYRNFIFDLIHNNTFKDSEEFKDKLNLKMTKKILELLKRDLKAIPLEYKSLYLEIRFHNTIKGRDIYTELEKYRNDDCYTIPFEDFNLFEKVTNELYSFDILFKYKKNYKNVESMPSQGEISLLFLLSSIYSSLIPILKDEQNDHKEYFKNNVMIILDEPMNSLHPQWQKNFIYNLINFLKENFPDIEFQIVLTTHSPFILSDLPKEYVIFLDKFDYKTKEKYPKLDIKDLKNGNCINVSEHIELKTFGANIHTLLSNGFFMSDGLMGEFAKGKINEIKDFYDANKNLKKEDSNFESKKDEFEKNKKYFENIQKIIGEPFLKTIIKNYLDELEILFNGKKEFLDKEIKKLQELRKSLNDKT